MATVHVHRVLITGASGLLGRALMKEFSNSNAWQVLGLAHSRVSGNLKKVNLLDFDETKRIVENFKPHLLIHSAAERRPDVVENDQVATRKLNVETVEFLAQLIESFNQGLESPRHFLLYVSTDYVFDGTKAPYKPDDAPNPLNKYGKSKLEGEMAVKRFHPNGLILRVPVLYGDVETLQESAVTVLLNAIKEIQKPAEIDDYRIRYPTLVDDVAGVCSFITERKIEDPTLSGVFHWSGEQQMTKYAMTCQMAELFGLSITHLKGNKNPPTGPTNRPYNTALYCGRLEEMLGKRKQDYKTPFNEGIQIYRKTFA